MSELLTEQRRPMLKKEYFDHVNDCEPKTLNWIDGDAYCPECGEHGVVYTRDAWYGTRPASRSSRKVKGIK